MSEKIYWKIESEEDYNRVCEMTGKVLSDRALTDYGFDIYVDDSDPNNVTGLLGHNGRSNQWYENHGYALQSINAPRKRAAWNRTVTMERVSDGVVFTKDAIDGTTLERIHEDRKELREKLAALNKLVATYKRLDKAGKLD